MEVEPIGELGLIKKGIDTVHGNTYVVGTSVLAVKYNEGVMIASDTQLSYGSYAKYKNIQRVSEISPTILLASSGEYSNHQQLVKQLRIEINTVAGEQCIYGPIECFEMIKNHMYAKRCKGKPEMNTHIVAGIDTYKNTREKIPYENESDIFLGAVDHLGNFYQANAMATGIGAHLAKPILEKRLIEQPELSEEEAKDLLVSAMRVLVYRDTRASPWVQLSKITKAGIEIQPATRISTDWSIGH
ncbi:20S proteasome subunit beta 7 [Nematocida sp. AWRm80]|nr:20S proteasome subunit beta 7 [Nematocida sp. AWRm80]